MTETAEQTLIIKHYEDHIQQHDKPVEHSHYYVVASDYNTTAECIEYRLYILTCQSAHDTDEIVCVRRNSCRASGTKGICVPLSA